MFDQNSGYLVTTPSMSMDHALAGEFLKGECAAWKRVLELPEELMESSQLVVDEFRNVKEEEEDGDES